MNHIPELAYSAEIEPNICELVKSVGLVKVTGLLRPGELEELNREFEELLATPREGVRDLGVEGGEARDVMPADLVGEPFPAMVRFFSQPWMQRVSELYWGDERVLNDHIFVTREIPGTRHLAQELHFDVQETLKFFLYLNDVTVDNGAFSCVPGSIDHTRRVRAENGGQLSYENREYSRQHPYKEAEVVPVEAPAGTLIVFTTEVWHRAGRVSQGERRVMRGHTRARVKPRGPAKAKTGSARKAPRVEASWWRRFISGKGVEQR